jgi:hypothetical protein
MVGLGVKVYTDEDVDTDLAVQLRRHGYDVVSCREQGYANRGLSDEWQLTQATTQGRAILVHNVADYAQLDLAWKAVGRAHAGIIASPRLRIGELVRRTRRHLDTIPPKFQADTLLWL